MFEDLGRTAKYAVVAGVGVGTYIFIAPQVAPMIPGQMSMQTKQILVASGASTVTYYIIFSGNSK